MDCDGAIRRFHWRVRDARDFQPAARRVQAALGTTTVHRSAPAAQSRSRPVIERDVQGSVVGRGRAGPRSVQATPCWPAGTEQTNPAVASPSAPCTGPRLSALRPVTPEVAGSSPVGPANLKHSCAATSRRFVFPEGRLENWRLAKSLARPPISRAEFCADPRPKRRNVSHFGVSVPRKKRVTTALKNERGARTRPGRACEVRRFSMARIGARVAAREGHARLRGGSASSCASGARDASRGDVRPFGAAS